jgi:hypothetical protein
MSKVIFVVFVSSLLLACGDFLTDARCTPSELTSINTFGELKCRAGDSCAECAADIEEFLSIYPDLSCTAQDAESGDTYLIDEDYFWDSYNANCSNEDT